MSAVSVPVSVVIPCLDDRDLLEKHLPPLLAELARRDVGDEVWVVDDTGQDVLRPWLAEHFASVSCHPLPENGGFARALASGVEAASHEFVFCMNPDILVHVGFLDPLVRELADPSVHSSVPRILLFGNQAEVESLTAIGIREGLAYVDQPGLAECPARYEHGVHPVAYAIGGGMCLRRSEFLASGGFDPLYEPFYFEDTDLGLMAWRAGRRVHYVAESVVEHHHRGTIRRRIPRPFVRAIIERNRYLLQWKFADDPAWIEEHVSTLVRQAVDAHLEDDRRELVWLLLALEHREALLRSRGALPEAERGFAWILEHARPDAP